MLLGAGADVRHRNNAGDTPLHFLVNVTQCRRLLEAEMAQLAKALLAAGAEREARDGQGKTARALAQEQGLALLAQALAA
jgi:hypothetical protein